MSLNEHSCPALARGVRLQNDPKDGEPLLLFPEGVLHLSETSYEILRLCNGSQPVQRIVGLLAETYEAEPNILLQDVLDCLRDLSERKLVVV